MWRKLAGRRGKEGRGVSRVSVRVDGGGTAGGRRREVLRFITVDPKFEMPEGSENVERLMQKKERGKNSRNERSNHIKFNPLLQILIRDWNLSFFLIISILSPRRQIS